MAGPERGRTASPVAVPRGLPAARAPLGAIGEASQLVEAALQARSAASQDQRFATTTTLFFALSSLAGALRLELRLRELGQVERGYGRGDERGGSALPGGSFLLVDHFFCNVLL